MSQGALNNPLGGTAEQGPFSESQFGLNAAPMRTTVDLWDLGQGDYLDQGSTVPGVGQFSNATAHIDGESNNKDTLKRVLGIALLCVVAAVAVYYLLPSDKDPFMVEYDSRGNPVPKAPNGESSILDKAKTLLGLEEPIPMPVPVPEQRQTLDPIPSTPSKTSPRTVVSPVTDMPTLSPVSDVRVVEIVEGNPYWILPNQLRGAEPKLVRAWGADEEDAWRRMLASGYSYQHYKAVEDIRIRKLRGSEVLLFEALNSPKFWTRMAALIGIAEFGYPVDMATVDRVLQGVRSDLVANYFKRFRLRPSGAESFILRHAVKLVGERARLHILQSLARSPDDLSKLYLVGAIYDQGEKIQPWIHSAINRVKIKTDTFLLYDKIVKGFVKPPLAMMKDDFLTKDPTNYERSRELAKGIQLYGGITEEIKKSESNEDGFSDLKVIEVKPEEF